MKSMTFAPLTSEIGNIALDVIFGNVLAYRPESLKSCDSPSNPLNPLIRCGRRGAHHPQNKTAEDLSMRKSAGFAKTHQLRISPVIGECRRRIIIYRLAA
jgi:hypothetical protein